MYDSDVIIVGAGPAGLSAAARARRVRTFNLLPASVTIISNSDPGGLADWWKVRVTGDGWSYEKGELTKKLLTDVHDYNIPIIQETVNRVYREDDIVVVATDDKKYRCLAAVVCTGMRVTWNEREFFPKKLYGTLKGYRYMEEYFSRKCEENTGKRIIFVGTPPMDTTLELFERINKGRMEMIVVEDTGRNIRGYKETEDGKISVLTADKEITGDLILVDFESYMNNNLSCPNILENTGFQDIDRKYRISHGIYAAGDVTGTPFSIAKAVGEGTSAGLEAYDHVHRAKFGKPAPLFAFYPNHRESQITRFEIPELKDFYRPKFLGNYEEKKETLVFRETSLERNKFTIPLLKACDGSSTLEQLRSKFPPDIVEDTITTLIHGKDLTLEV